jgi:hypothetical protein
MKKILLILILLSAVYADRADKCHRIGNAIGTVFFASGCSLHMASIFNDNQTGQRKLRNLSAQSFIISGMTFVVTFRLGRIDWKDRKERKSLKK